LITLLKRTFLRLEMGARKGKSVPEATTVRSNNEGIEMNQDQLRLVLPAGVDMESMSKARVSMKMLPKIRKVTDRVGRGRPKKGQQSRGVWGLSENMRLEIGKMAVERGYKDTREHFNRLLGFNIYNGSITHFKRAYLNKGKCRGVWGLSENVRLEIGKMAVERGYRDTVEHFSRLLGFNIFFHTIVPCKRAYLNKGQGEGQNSKNGEGEVQGQGGEDQGHGGKEQVNWVVSNSELQVLQVNTGEVSTTNQEQSEIVNDANEEDEEIQEQESVGGGSSTTASCKENDDLNQVKEQGIESEDDQDLSVQFDTRAVYKETPIISAMKKYEELVKKIQVRKEETRLLEKEEEELAEKLSRELAKGRAEAV